MVPVQCVEEVPVLSLCSAQIALLQARGCMDACGWVEGKGGRGHLRKAPGLGQNMACGLPSGLGLLGPNPTYALRETCWGPGFNAAVPPFSVVFAYRVYLNSVIKSTSVLGA